MCHGLHWAACTLGPGDPHRRPVEQKKEGLGSIVSPGGPARKQQTLALISSSNSNWDLIPTHATPNYALPLQQSRTSLPNPSRQRCSASLPKPGPAYSSLPKHPGWSNIRPTCQNPSPVTPRPLPGPPPPPSTPHGDDHHDPHDPKDAIISIAGPGTPPRRPGRPAKTLTIQLTSPRSSHLIECGIGPG